MILKRSDRKKFGEIAVEKGFVSEHDVEKALLLQARLKQEGCSELIGMIMLKNDMLTNEQLIEILKYYEEL
jgi:hypothetical protein